MSQPPFSPARFAEALPNGPRASAEWSVFSLHVIDSLPPQHETTFTDHAVTLRLSGTVRVRLEVNGRVDEGWSAPGCVGVMPAGFEHKPHHQNWAHARLVAVYIPDAFLARVIAQDWGAEPRTVELVRQFLIRDPIIEGVLTSLAVEAMNGSPSGRLYAECACEFLAHHLVHQYSSVSRRQSAHGGGLAGYRLKRVLEYIHDNLGRSIALRDLAELAGVSPRHFERAFRQAVGMAPYIYVMQQRVGAARDVLLGDPTLSISEVAQRTGFSSSSRLATAFRRHTGYSPMVFRRIHS